MSIYWGGPPTSGQQATGQVTNKYHLTKWEDDKLNAHIKSIYNMAPYHYDQITDCTCIGTRIYYLHKNNFTMLVVN